MRNKWLYVGAAGVLGLLGIVWWQSQKSATPTGPQDAVNPNAQVNAGAFAQNATPDIGNLLSYNQIVGSTAIIPQATSVDPFAGNYYNPGWTTVPTYAAPGTS
jgi:hypothetical protein